MNRTLLALELRRLRRNRRTQVFATVFPVVFYLLFTSGSGQGDRLGGTTVAAYFMISMATYGALNALFTGGGVIAAERAAGWNRQLRIAGLRPRDYVATKVLVAYLAALPGLVVVFVLGSTVRHVHLSAGHWVLAGVSILLGLLPVAALGVAIGYLARPSSLQQIFGIGSALLALLGGVWFPVEQFPAGVRTVLRLLPTYWSTAAGRSVLFGSWVGWQGVAVIAVWTVLLGALATRAYQRDGLRPAMAGTA